MNASEQHSNLYRVSLVCGIIPSLLGVAVLIGWYTNIPILIQVHSSFVPMQYNTALCFLLTGVGLLSLLGHRRRLTLTMALIVGLIGVITFFEYLLGVNVGIDQLFMQHYITTETSNPGRMAPNTALNFSLSSAIIFLAARDKPNWTLLLISAAAVMFLGVLALIGYGVGLTEAYGWANLTRMAVHTASGFIVFSLGAAALAIERSRLFAESIAFRFGSTLIAFTLLFLIWTAFGHLLNLRILASSNVLNSTVFPASTLSAEIIDDLADINSDVLAYVNGDSARLEEFNQDFGEIVIAMNQLLVIVPDRGAQLEEIRSLIDKYVLESRTLVFDRYDPEVESDAKEVVEGLKLTSFQQLDQLLNDAKGIEASVSFSERDTLIFELLDESADMANNLTEHVSGIFEAQQDFVLNAAEFENYFSELENSWQAPGFDQFLSSVETLYLNIQLQAEGVFSSYDPVSKGQAVQSVRYLEREYRENLETLLEGFNFEIQQVARDSLEELADISIRNDALLTIVSLALVLAAMLFTYWVTNRFVRPIRDLQVVMSDLATGNHDVVVKNLGRSDEIGKMAETVEVFKQNAKIRAQMELRILERTNELEEAKIRAEDLRDEAQAATRAKAEFLATMSHEIRTPMNAIIGMVDLIRQSKISPEHQRMLQTVSSSGQSLMTVINDILDFSKAEAGKLELESIPFDIREVVENVVEALKPLVRKKNLELVLYIDPEIPQWVLGDPVRVGQILNNLISNAVKFTDKGEIYIRVEILNSAEGCIEVDFRVIDQGVGISKEVQEKLFQSFSQAESSTTRKYGGTGLGLAICQSLTALMGGEIGMKSELGKGSEFHLNLSFLLGEEGEEQGGLEERGSLKGLKVLIVSANDKEKYICKKYLEYWQVKVDIVEESGDPVSAIKSYLQNHEKPDLVISGVTREQNKQVEIRNDLTRSLESVGLKLLVLMRGLRSQPRLDNPMSVSLDANPLKRISFLNAVSIATGRASPEAYVESVVEVLSSAVEPLSVDQAIDQNCLILVAEDNLTNQDVMGRQLTLLGYTYEMAENGEQALKAWETGCYAVLLTDCHMPEMDGYQLVAAIRKAEKKSEKRTPIIAVTANVLHGEAQRCISVGMDDYLSKPLDMRELRERLRKWMPQYQPSSRDDSAAISAASGSESKGNKDSESAVDASVLKNIFGDDEGAFKEILNDFLEPSREIIEEISVAYSDRSADALKQAAHKLKSAAFSIGAGSLGEQCKILETASKESNWKVIDAGVPRIDELMEQVEKYVKQLD